MGAAFFTKGDMKPRSSGRFPLIFSKKPTSRRPLLGFSPRRARPLFHNRADASVTQCCWPGLLGAWHLEACCLDLPTSGTLSGNLIISRGADVQQEMQDLLNAFAPSGLLAFGFPAPETSISPFVCGLVDLSPQRTKLENCADGG